MESTNVDALLWCPTCRDIIGHHVVSLARNVYKCLRCKRDHSAPTHQREKNIQSYKLKRPGKGTAHK